MEPGQLIGHYRIIAKLGKGGMGAVYAAQHTILGKRVALKVLLPELSLRSDLVKRFFNEARAASRVEHPGIREVYDLGETPDGDAFIVMQLLDGEPLGRRLQRGPLSSETTIALSRQLAGALYAAHAAGIIHRDLKPDNIFLVPDQDIAIGERAKVLDFGIAKLRDTVGVGTGTGLIMGTPPYMAPEQCRGLRDVDHRADAYALGCVIFAMATGQPPFTDELAGDLLAAHMFRPAPRLRSLAPEAPAALEAIVARLLAKNPADRHASLGAVAAELAALENGPPGDPSAAPTPPPARAVWRRAETTVATGDSHASRVEEPVLPRAGWRRQVPLVALACGALFCGGAVAAVVRLDQRTRHEVRRTPVARDAGLSPPPEVASYALADAGEATVALPVPTPAAIDAGTLAEDDRVREERARRPTHRRKRRHHDRAEREVATDDDAKAAAPRASTEADAGLFDERE